ncbi:hypothetical protein E0M29_27255 [Bacillus cereus]|uniref:hypothetical protein n=1 Tax=Bacillus cereus TaxID=1396 RepID=UPI0010388372|nr:hypothetical protein [Bacillus cereus]TBX84271.1 hypothetical protein E0M29_27255 [Bacillus cereus]
MPEEQQVDWQEWMIELATDNAGPLAKELFSQALKKYFDKDQINLEVLFQNAINEICNRIEEIINEAFLNQYLSDCDFLSDQFVIYSNSSSTTVLNKIQERSSELVNRFNGLGYKGIGGFFIAANMHLLSLRALDNKENTKYFCEKYIDMGKEFNEQLDSRAKSFDGVVKRYEGSWRVDTGDDENNRKDFERYHVLTGEYPSYNVYYPTIFFAYHPNDGGNSIFFASPTAFSIDNERVELLQRQCDEKKETIFNNKVKPILDMIEKNSQLLDIWKSWKF